MNNFRSIPNNSYITGNQIQLDAVTTSLIVACDPHLLVPRNIRWKTESRL